MANPAHALASTTLNKDDLIVIAGGGRVYRRRARAPLP